MENQEQPTQANKCTCPKNIKSMNSLCDFCTRDYAVWCMWNQIFQEDRMLESLAASVRNVIESCGRAA